MTIPDVLLVEDNPGDIRVTREVLGMARIDHTLHVVCDGAAALDFLHRKAAYATAPRPDLIVLDLTLPRLSGREVLGALKQDEQLRAIPVVVFSTSDAPEDLASAYALDADYYLTKPFTYDDFAEVAARLASFWHERARACAGVE